MEMEKTKFDMLFIISKENMHVYYVFFMLLNLVIKLLTLKNW